MKFATSVIRGALALAALMVASTQTHAATTLYTNKSLFAANAGVIDRTENFESTGYSVLQNYGTIATSFGRFRNTAGRPVTLVPPSQSNFDLGGAPVGSIVLTSNGEDDFTVDLNAPLYALGLDAFTNDYGSTYIRFYAGSDLLRTMYIGPDSSKANNRRFVGITSDTAITRFTFDSTLGDIRNAGIDNLLGATAAPVPEASTWAMMILGLGFAGYSLRRPVKGQRSALV